MAVETYAYGGRVVQVARFSEEVSGPAPSTSYVFPSYGSLDLRGFGSKSFEVEADQPVDVQLEESGDGSAFSDLEGYSIPSGSFAPNKINTIHTNKPMRFVRVRVTTGAAAPSFIRVSLTATR